LQSQFLAARDAAKVGNNIVTQPSALKGNSAGWCARDPWRTRQRGGEWNGVHVSGSPGVRVS
jgi:hypothetical protein